MVRFRPMVVFPDGVFFPEGAPKGAIRRSDLAMAIRELLKTDGVTSTITGDAWIQITRTCEKGIASAPPPPPPPARPAAGGAKKGGRPGGRRAGMRRMAV